MSPRRYLSVLLIVLLAAACTRSRSPSTAPDAASPVPGVGATSSDLSISRPAVNSPVRSPLVIEGTVRHPDGHTLAAVVYRREADGALGWCGNGPLAVDGERFSGTVPYSLEADAPGVVEVVVIDPVSGTVIDRRSVPVELQTPR